jgi:hypothetical protein
VYIGTSMRIVFHAILWICTFIATQASAQSLAQPHGDDCNVHRATHPFVQAIDWQTPLDAQIPCTEEVFAAPATIERQFFSSDRLIGNGNALHRSPAYAMHPAHAGATSIGSVPEMLGWVLAGMGLVGFLSRRRVVSEKFA